MTDKTYFYYEVYGRADGVWWPLFGSYDRDQANYELIAERDNWYDEGYRGMQVRRNYVTEAPDREVYPPKEFPHLYK